MEKLKGLYIYETREELFRSAARVFIELCYDGVARRGFFAVALSGGETPKGFYSLLASDEFRGRVPWKDIHFFWGDERCVPPDDAESNFGAARRLMFSKAAVPEGNIHRMRGEMEPARAAAEYEEEISRFFRERGQEGLPSFDLVLYGFGKDGHTLSLFPGGPELSERKRLVVESAASNGGRRLTMTLPLVRNARAGAFLVSGGAKAGMLRELMEGGGARYPAGMVAPSSGNLVWFVDREAAEELLKQGR